MGDKNFRGSKNEDRRVKERSGDFYVEEFRRIGYFFSRKGYL